MGGQHLSHTVFCNRNSQYAASPSLDCLGRSATMWRLSVFCPTFSSNLCAFVGMCTHICMCVQLLCALSFFCCCVHFLHAQLSVYMWVSVYLFVPGTGGLTVSGLICWMRLT